MAHLNAWNPTEAKSDFEVCFTSLKANLIKLIKNLTFVESSYY